MALTARGHDGAASGPLAQAGSQASPRPRAHRTGLNAIGAALAALSLAAPARADDDTTPPPTAAEREKARPHTLAEVNTGFFLLPGALVCPVSLDPATCQRGEFSWAIGLQNLYQFGPFAFGAGIDWATTLRSDAAHGDPSLQREHTRRYFLVEGLFRYYFATIKSWSFWAGGTVGLVVVNDSWSENADRNPPTDTEFVGPRADTIGTVGFTLGGAAAAEWAFLPNWSFGPSLRYANWFLPETRQVSPTLDVASLAGRLDMIDVSVRITYHLPL